MIICSDKLSLIKHIMRVGAESSFLFCTTVLNPSILKSASLFTAFVSVSTRNIMLSSFCFKMFLSSCSRMIRPLLIFQLHTLICLLFELFVLFDAISTGFGFESMEADLPTDTGFGYLVGVPPGSVEVVLVGLEELDGIVGMMIVLSPSQRVSSLWLPVFALIGLVPFWSPCRPLHSGGFGEPLSLSELSLVFSSGFVFRFFSSCRGRHTGFLNQSLT